MPSYVELSQHIEQIPLHAYLGLKVEDLQTDYARLRLPFRPEFIGNANWNVWHGGLIATLADACGMAALWTVFTDAHESATVDLRIDYLRPAHAGDIIAEGEVRYLGSSIANVVVRLSSPDTPDYCFAEARAVCYVRQKERLHPHMGRRKIAPFAFRKRKDDVA